MSFERMGIYQFTIVRRVTENRNIKGLIQECKSNAVIYVQVLLKRVIIYMQESITFLSENKPTTHISLRSFEANPWDFITKQRFQQRTSSAEINIAINCLL